MISNYTIQPPSVGPFVSFNEETQFIVVKKFTPVSIVWLLRDQFEKMPEIEELNLDSHNCIIDGETNDFRFVIHMYDGNDGTTVVTVEYSVIHPNACKFLEKIKYALHV